MGAAGLRRTSRHCPNHYAKCVIANRERSRPLALSLGFDETPALMQINRKLWADQFFCGIVGLLSLKCCAKCCTINRFICALDLRRMGTRRRGYRVSLYMSLQDFARAQPAFLTQNLHQPAGLISPSTSVQAFGSWNREQLLHC
jgi:hypothetical protein